MPVVEGVGVGGKKEGPGGRKYKVGERGKNKAEARSKPNHSCKSCFVNNATSLSIFLFRFPGVVDVGAPPSEKEREERLGSDFCPWETSTRLPHCPWHAARKEGRKNIWPVS